MTMTLVKLRYNSKLVPDPGLVLQTPLCYEFLAMLEGKMREASFFKVQFGKITVWPEIQLYQCGLATEKRYKKLHQQFLVNLSGRKSTFVNHSDIFHSFILYFCIPTYLISRLKILSASKAWVKIYNTQVSQSWRHPTCPMSKSPSCPMSKFPKLSMPKLLKAEVAQSPSCPNCQKCKLQASKKTLSHGQEYLWPCNSQKCF